MRTGFMFAAFLIGGCQPAQQTNVTADNSEQPQIGRYVIVHSPHIQRDTILLDTATGRTWQQVLYNDLENDPVGWEPMARSDNEDEMTALRANNPSDSSSPARPRNEAAERASENESWPGTPVNSN